MPRAANKTNHKTITFRITVRMPNPMNPAQRSSGRNVGDLFFVVDNSLFNVFSPRGGKDEESRMKDEESSELRIVNGKVKSGWTDLNRLERTWENPVRIKAGNPGS